MRGCLLMLVWAIVTVAAHADGGTLRLLERRGNLQVGVFTAPAAPRVGPLDVSILVQDFASAKRPLDGNVIVRLTQGWITLVQPATSELATNKLFQAAHFELPAAGSWLVEIIVDGDSDNARFSFALEAAEALPPWREWWPWLAWPLLPIALFGFQQVRLARRKTSPA